jgi:isocitrate/isopropylmalate dehydrogenase
MVLQMFGSIAGSESLVISVDESGHVDCVMAEAPHGTAPSLEGRNVANPMAMILAAAALLGHIETNQARQASRAVYEATLETVYDGIRTADLGGSANTDEFTNEVIRRVKTKLEVWSTLS